MTIRTYLSLMWTFDVKLIFASYNVVLSHDMSWLRNCNVSNRKCFLGKWKVLLCNEKTRNHIVVVCIIDVVRPLNYWGFKTTSWFLRKSQRYLASAGQRALNLVSASAVSREGGSGWLADWLSRWLAGWLAGWLAIMGTPPNVFRSFVVIDISARWLFIIIQEFLLLLLLGNNVK